MHEIARGSALECAAVQDVLVVGKALDKTESQSRKMELDRMAAMLSRLGGRGYQVREDRTIYGDRFRFVTCRFDAVPREEQGFACQGQEIEIGSIGFFFCT